jgi:two-component system, NarL family, response regulator NreC
VSGDTEMKRTTVVLADDHQIVRRGIRSVLSAETDIEVVGEADDGFQACDLVQELMPDVLVLDLAMPGMHGFEVAERAAGISPKTRTVVLSMYDDIEYVARALRLGIKGYVLKRSVAEHLVRAIRESLAGRCYVSPPLSQDDVEALIVTNRRDTADPYDTLTPREREALYLAARGCNRVQIASQLYISKRTAEKHRASAMRKLSLHNQSELVRYAVERGLLPPDHRLT